MLSENTASGTSCGSSWLRSTTSSAAKRFRRASRTRRPQTNTTAEHGPLHVNPYPNTDSPGETAECEAGNEPYSGAAAAIGNVPGEPGPEDREDHAVRANHRERKEQRGKEMRRRRRRVIPNLAAGADRRGRDRRRGLSDVRRYRRRSRARRSCSRRCSRARPSCTSPRRSGSRASTSARSRRSSASGATRQRRSSRWRSTGRPADPRRRDRRDPVADLPRGQLLRRPAPRYAERAAARLGSRRCPRPTPRARSSSTACSPRSTPTRAPTCRRSCRASAPPQRAADTGPGRDPGPKRAGPDGRPGAQPVAQVLGRRVQGLGDRQPGAARGRRPHDLSRSSRATRRCSGRSRSRQSQLAGLVDNVRRDDARRSPPASRT